MSVNKVIAAATLPAMIASPVAAAADNPASSLSLRSDTAVDAATSADAEGTQAAQVPVPAAAAATAGGVSTALLVGGALVALVVIGAVVMGSGHHGSQPASA